MTQPSVLIIGSGPSAAYAFRACRDNGIIPIVISPTAADRTRGAFWLTWLPESVEPERVREWRIEISATGTAEGYMKKQWHGDYAEAASSFPNRHHSTRVYDPIEGMRALWGPASIQQCAWLDDRMVCKWAGAYDLVIQTFPTQLSKEAQPLPRKVWVVSSPKKRLPNYVGVCEYSGLESDDWIRYTYAFGELNIEFSQEGCAQEFRAFQAREGELYTPTIHIYPNLTPDTQVLDESSAPNVLLTGRFARWDRKELSHHSYNRVDSKLKEMMQR